jgi:phytoene/squalene synthetase
MQTIYDNTTFLCSQIITKQYSTSFSLGIRTLHPQYRMPIYAIYGFVRYADEIVDTFHDKDKDFLLQKFKADTFEAIRMGISLNPVLHAFQRVVNQYEIDHSLIEAFLHSMELDLQKKGYEQGQYQEYIYGSAEVVGLMCLKVFCAAENGLYEKLKAPARSLGAAFQKVNFLRDIQSDFQERGRVYFPGIDFHAFTNEQKAQIEADIQNDFNDAYKGIVQLPKSARMGVYLAYVYYLKLFAKIKALPARTIMHARIRVPDQQKLALLMQTYFKHSLNFL